jgi:hypothetical protein
VGTIELQLLRALIKAEIASILSVAARSNGILDAQKQARVLMEQYPIPDYTAEELVNEIGRAALAAGVRVSAPSVSGYPAEVHSPGPSFPGLLVRTE